MKKKYLLLILLSFFFLIPSVKAAESYQQIFSTDESGTLTTLDGLTTYDIGAGVKFTYYQFHFTNTTLEKGKTYHVKINLFGTLTDGFYQFDKNAWEFWSYDSATQKVDKLNAYDLKLTGSGQYRSIEFDFYNATDYRSYRIAAANPDGMLYYQWQGSGKFGWYSFNIEKINDSDDIIIAQNDLVIKNQQETNKKLDDLNKTNKDTQDFLKDDTEPDSDISALGNVQGLLPPGPVDSLLNIPFQFLSVVTSSISGTCVPVSGKFVFDSTLTLPCFDELLWNSEDLDSNLMNYLSLIPAAFILIKYFKHLYKKVDRATSLNTNADDEWGVL